MSQQLPKTMNILEQGIEQQLHPGAQLYVSLAGETVADIAIGEARPGVPMQTDTLLKWMSCSKPLTAAATMQLVEQGKLQLDQPISAYIPKFAVNGKETITLRHILTHTAGFPVATFKWPADDWDTVIEKICNSRLKREWVPGERAAYHASTSWFILGQLIRLKTEQPVEQYVRENVFLPLGMDDCHLAMPREQFDGYGEQIGYLYHTQGDQFTPGSGSLDYANRCHRCAPGGSGVGPIRQLAQFYEALSRGGDGVLKPATVDLMTQRHRKGIRDEVFGCVIDWGLGLIVASNQYNDFGPIPYGFGSHASEEAFGHGGHETSISFCDPAHDLVVAWCCNGMAGRHEHEARNHAINSAIYGDLGLAG